ncbi:DMT family transporter [Pleionea sediminis]|uniref:DMT family transporter n=1 Tax=Pleionea sediminis TaxID=2569479 RepID=UPI001186B965|nr:DMT family transporter [Pleionea sediminis]
MHQTSGQWKLGLLLSLTTAVLWGLLPIALKGLLEYTDPITIIWFRFAIAGTFLFAFLAHQKSLPQLSSLKRYPILFLVSLVILGLLGNYAFYQYGLSYVTPGSAQVMIQTAPMLLLLGGLIVFKERFHTAQWFGLIVFCVGLILFFNQRFDTFFNTSDEFSIGLFLIFIAGVLWAIYALAQKQLLLHYESEQIMIMIYIAGIIVFIPNSDITFVNQLDTLGWVLLIFCGANTLVAYGAFAEALAHWEASRVSATLAITPLLTLMFMQLTDYLFPGYMQPEPVNSLSIIGALLVVAGSAVTALSKSKKLESDIKALDTN